MRHIRIVLGVVLLIASITGVFFWETIGRSKLMMEEVIAAGRDIRAGAVIEESMLIVIEIPKGSRVKKGFSAEEWGMVIGKTTTLPISGKQQLSADFFLDETTELAEDEAFFKIPGSWIAMRSSSLRRGDYVEIFGDNISDNFGVFKLASVKNANENEVKDISIKGDVLNEPEAICKRLDSDSVIDHVEIVTTPEKYYNLRAYAESRGEASLVLVRRDKETKGKERQILSIGTGGILHGMENIANNAEDIPNDAEGILVEAEIIPAEAEVTLDNADRRDTNAPQIEDGITSGGGTSEVNDSAIAVNDASNNKEIDVTNSSELGAEDLNDTSEAEIEAFFETVTAQ